MQKNEGDGCFITGGTLAKKVTSRRSFKVDTGCIVGFTKDVDYDIEFIGGIKNSVLEARIVYALRVLEPFTYNHYPSAADRIIASAPSGRKQPRRRQFIGGLGNLLDGDNRY
jgi:hypothetical protein